MKARLPNTVAVGFATRGALMACARAGEGEYEVQRPVVGTVTDTARVATVEVSKDTHLIVTPDIDVNRGADSARDTTRR